MVNEREREWESDVNNVSKASEVSFEGRAAVGCIALRFMNLELSPKSFPLICEYLDWRRPGVPVPQKKKHIDPITHQMCWFSGTGGDRTLDQQAISLPSGRITHNWTDSMQKNKTFLPFKWSLKDSLCIVLSSTPSHSFSAVTSFLSVPPVMNCSLYSHLSCPCCFFALTDRFESLLRLAVFLSFSPPVSSSLCDEKTEIWQLWITTCYSSQSNCDDLVSWQTWPGGMRWWSLHCQTSSQQVLFFRLLITTKISIWT